MTKRRKPINAKRVLLTRGAEFNTILPPTKNWVKVSLLPKFMVMRVVVCTFFNRSFATVPLPHAKGLKEPSHVTT